VVGELLTKQGKDLFKKKRGSDDGRASVMSKPITLKNLSTSSELGTSIDQRNLIALSA
jgi:hypothetical protein